MSGANMSNSNNPENVGGGNHEPSHQTSREWVKTDTDEKKKEWWKDFRAEVLRKYNEQAIKPGTKINKSRTFIDDSWVLNEDTVIDGDGNLVDTINDADVLLWQQDSTIKGINYAAFTAVNAKDCFTKRLGSELCEDLGMEKIKWDDYKDQSLSDYLTEIHEILINSGEMPKVRHRHKFLGFGNDKKTKTDGRRLADYIDLEGNPKWETLGNNEEERKETLVRKAKDEEKGKKLCKLLKCKKSYKEITDNVQQAPTAMTTQPQVASQTLTAETPTVTMPPSVEKIKLYHGASQEWKKKLPWWDRFSDWLNRKWFRFRFKNEIYNDEAGYKAAYRNYCHRDWDTGRDAGGINR